MDTANQTPPNAVSSETSHFCQCPRDKEVQDESYTGPVLCGDCDCFLVPTISSATNDSQTMLKKKTVLDEKDVYLAFREPFRAQTSAVAKLLKSSKMNINAIIKKVKNQRGVAKLIDQYGMETVRKSVRGLLVGGVFASPEKAMAHFPELFVKPSIDGQEREAPETENAAVVPDVIHTRPTEDSTRQGLEDENTTEASLSSALPLFPACLPFPIQHKLMVELQTLLERLCYAFGHIMMKETLQKRGWNCAESAELNHWMDEFIRNPTLISMAGNRGPLEELFRSVTEIRDIAVYRKHTDSEGMRKLLMDAAALADLLHIEEYISIIDKFHSLVNLALSDLDHKKSLLQSQLDVEQRRIAAERARLDQEESVTIAKMREKNCAYQNLIGTRLIQGIINIADGTTRAALSDGDNLAESNDSDGVMTPEGEEDDMIITPRKYDEHEEDDYYEDEYRREEYYYEEEEDDDN